MYFVSQTLLQPKPKTITTETAPASRYFLSIIDASWGANCDANSSRKGYQSSKPSPKENNVLSVVSNMCNGKPSCDIPVDSEQLGIDPDPSCGYKMLQVNYRCFLVDKLHTVEMPNGTMSIDCEKLLEPKLDPK